MRFNPEHSASTCSFVIVDEHIQFTVVINSFWTAQALVTYIALRGTSACWGDVCRPLAASVCPVCAPGFWGTEQQEMWPLRVSVREVHPTWLVTPLVSAAATPTHILECLFRSEYEDICCSIFCHRTRRTNFKGNHNYSCGSNSFSAEYREALEKFQAQFNPGRLFFWLRIGFFFFSCSVRVRYHWCPWCRLWPGPPAAARAALWCRSEQHGAALRSCGQETQKQTGGGWGQGSRECGKEGGQGDEVGNKSLWWL